MKLPDDWILWSAQDIAAYLDKGRSTVYRYMADPDFPKAERPGGGHPRWRAVEVRAWALRQNPAKAA